MLYRRLLIGILNTSLGNTVKKLSIYKIFYQLYNFFYSYHVYFILWIKSVLPNGGAWVVCWRNNCLIPNIKTDKKVTFLALVQVLQWNSHRFLIYVHSKWLKTFNMCNCKSLFKQILPMEKKTARKLYPAIRSNAHDHVIYFKA